MSGRDALAERFESHRGHLRAVAYRMLGSLSDADEAVQETWLRLDGSDAESVRNLAGWLTTVISRICLDMLRARKARHDEPVGELPEQAAADVGPEEEAMLAESVGRALLVVLETLSPAERVALVLHDMFAVPFTDIAPIVERTPVTTKKLASRARRRMQGSAAVPSADLARQRRVVDAFLAASRGGDLHALLAVLAPDVVRRADPAALPAGAPTESRGADAVAAENVVFGQRSRFAEPALINGEVGVVVAPYGRLQVALAVTYRGEQISGYDVIADPARLAALTLAVLG